MLGEPREYREASRKLMSMLVWREELREALCLDWRLWAGDSCQKKICDKLHFHQY